MTQRVRSYRRADGTQVRSHQRDGREAWASAGKAWLFAGASGATAVAATLEAGFTTVTAVATITTLIFGIIAGEKTRSAARHRRTGPKKRRSRYKGWTTTTRPKAKKKTNKKRSHQEEMWRAEARLKRRARNRAAARRAGRAIRIKSGNALVHGAAVAGHLYRGYKARRSSRVKTHP